MQIVIDIPEYYYHKIEELAQEGYELQRIVTNGIKLPKGHGKLIDADAVIEKMNKSDAQPRTPNEQYAWDFCQAILKKAKPILEKEKETDI
jgi:hypothetical protein